MTITSIRADNALSRLVDAVIPRGSGRDGTGLWIRLDYRARNSEFVLWEGEIMRRAVGEHLAQEACAAMPDGLDEEEYPWYEDITASADVHLLAFRPTNYTQVYGLVDDKWSLPPADADWLLYIDHDSCWRTDGFRLLDEVRNHLRLEIYPEGTQPTDIRYDCSIARVERVTMATEAAHTDPYDPKLCRKVTSLKIKGGS